MIDNYRAWAYVASNAICGSNRCPECKELFNVDDEPCKKPFAYEELKDWIIRVTEKLKETPLNLSEDDIVKVLNNE